MPAPTPSHSDCVDAWLARATPSLPAAGLIQAFERAFSALWRRSHQTLGDVTLTAIVDRVLHTAAERHPPLSVLTLTANGLSSRGLLRRTQALPRQELEQGLRFVLVEYLSVLGNLTAEILTASLHAELEKLGPPREAERSESRKSAVGEAPKKVQKTVQKTVAKTLRKNQDVWE